MISLLTSVFYHYFDKRTSRKYGYGISAYSYSFYYLFPTLLRIKRTLYNLTKRKHLNTNYVGSKYQTWYKRRCCCMRSFCLCLCACIVSVGSYFMYYVLLHKMDYNIVTNIIENNFKGRESSIISN